MPNFIKTGFWERTCLNCKGYKGWLNLDELINSLFINRQPKYGSFYDTTEQASPSGIAAAMKFNTTDISNGVTITNDSLGNPTMITFDVAGVYDIQFSVQAKREQGGGGSAKKLIIWLKKNTIDIPWTSTFLGFVSNGVEEVAAWNFFIEASVGDKFQIMWLQDDDIRLVTIPENTHPATPSVILTVNQVN